MVEMVAAGEALEILESAAIPVLVLIQEVEFGLLKRMKRITVIENETG
jgi:hypothetical protein